VKLNWRPASPELTTTSRPCFLAPPSTSHPCAAAKAAAAGADPNAPRGAVVSINDHGNAVGAAPQLMYVPAAGYASGGTNLKAGSAATYA
jgi:hypothetical protein